MNECCFGLCAASVTVWAQHLYSTLFNMYVYFFSYWSFAQNSIVPYKTTFPRLPCSRRFLSLSCNWRDTSRSQLRISGEVLPFCSCSPSLALLLPIKRRGAASTAGAFWQHCRREANGTVLWSSEETGPVVAISVHGWTPTGHSSWSSVLASPSFHGSVQIQGFIRFPHRGKEER